MADQNDDRRRSALTQRQGTELSTDVDFGWVDPSWGARRRARGIGRTLDEYAGGMKIATRFVDAATDYQKSLREFELAREQRSLTPLMVEQQRHTRRDKGTKRDEQDQKCYGQRGVFGSVEVAVVGFDQRLVGTG